MRILNSPDEFSPGGNPQDRGTVIDPTKYLPQGFTPVYSDPADANATLQQVAADTQALIQAGGPMNQVLNTLLGVLGTALGATAKIAIP